MKTMQQIHDELADELIDAGWIVIRETKEPNVIKVKPREDGPTARIVGRKLRDCIGNLLFSNDEVSELVTMVTDWSERYEVEMERELRALGAELAAERKTRQRLEQRVGRLEVALRAKVPGLARLLREGEKGE